MEGMKDWNKMNTDEYIEHLENKFQFNSSGTAKAVFELIAAYKALKLTAVGVSEAEVCCFNCKHSASDIDFCTGMSVNCGKYEQT